MQRRYYLLVLLSSLLPIFLHAQSVPARDTTAQDTTNRKGVMIEFSDLMEFIQEEDQSFKKLSGHVALRQDSILMYCDTALLEGNKVIAFGNVIIQQGDSLTVFSDSLEYMGDKRVADLFGEVVLQDGDKELFTSYLNYDLTSKTGRYTQGGLVTQGPTQLISKKGVYAVNSKQLFFKDSVVVVNEKMTLRADTLEFDSESQIATFLGPTLIHQDSATIYCEAGFYDIATELAEFEKNAQYQKGQQKATADLITFDGTIKEIRLTGNANFIDGDKVAKAETIRYEEDTNLTFLEGNAEFKDPEQEVTGDMIKYDSEKGSFKTEGRSVLVDSSQILIADQFDFDSEQGLGFATGTVEWQDTIENLSIQSEELAYDKSKNYVKASGARPLLSIKVGKDTLYLASDTLISSETEDSLAKKILEAFTDVRIYKTNLQAVCDSLSYSASDSLFKLYEDPIIWSDTSQFKADSIYMYLANNQIDKIILYQNGLIINTPDFQYYNQIRGAEITAFFNYGNLNRMKVDGNAESIYFARDEEDAYLGMNQTTCSEMLILFGANEVDQIKFYSQPNATMFPIEKIQDSPPTLEGFRWDFEKRPESIVGLRKDKKSNNTKNTKGTEK